MYEYRASLTKVVDGDTIHASIDLGLDISTKQTIRFYGINAPETSTDEGKVASKWVQGWFTAHAPDGFFTLRTVKDRREKYGRYLGVILTTDGLHCLNDEIVAVGLAAPYYP